MAKRVKVKMNSAGMTSLLESGQMAADLEARAAAIAARARSSAPVQTGSYQGSIGHKVVPASALGISFKTGANNRPVAVVFTSAPHGLIVEANTGNLARALGAGS